MRVFEIDNKLNTGEITEEEAEQQKEKVRQDIDFFCNLPDDIETKVEKTITPSYWFK